MHDQTSRTGIDRRDGFLNEMKAKHPNIKIVSVQYGAGDHLKSAEIAKADLQANPNLKGIFGANEGSAEGAAIGVKESGKKVVLIGYDSGKEQMDAIRSGLMAGAITQNPVGIGTCVVEFGGEGAQGREAAQGHRHRLLLVRQDQHRRSQDRRGPVQLRTPPGIGEGLAPFLGFFRRGARACERATRPAFFVGRRLCGARRCSLYAFWCARVASGSSVANGRLATSCQNASGIGKRAQSRVSFTRSGLVTPHTVDVTRLSRSENCSAAAPRGTW